MLTYRQQYFSAGIHLPVGKCNLPIVISLQWKYYDQSEIHQAYKLRKVLSIFGSTVWVLSYCATDDETWPRLFIDPKQLLEINALCTSTKQCCYITWKIRIRPSSCNTLFLARIAHIRWDSKTLLTMQPKICRLLSYHRVFVAFMSFALEKFSRTWSSSWFFITSFRLFPKIRLMSC